MTTSELFGLLAHQELGPSLPPGTWPHGRVKIDASNTKNPWDFSRKQLGSATACFKRTAGRASRFNSEAVELQQRSSKEQRDVLRAYTGPALDLATWCQ